MKIITLARLITFVCVILLSTSNLFGQSLTENLAIGLIRKAAGYPKLVTIVFYDVERDSPIGQEILRLSQDGFMSSSPSREDPFSGINLYEITEKGKDIVERCTWNSTWKTHSLSAYTHKADIAKIEEILTDSQQGTGKVRYRIDYTATAYFDKLRSLDSELVDKKADLKKWRVIWTAVFKKYDQGWRIIYIN